ncbi:outer membrane beta-barrel family protein [Hymenobacter coalescens]
MKTLLTLSLAAAPLFLSQAQTAGSVTGRLLDERQQPLPFATVLLQATADTSRVRVELSKADGSYGFQGVAAGEYRLVVSMLGYQAHRSAPFGVADGAVQLPLVRLAPVARQLKGVEVVGQKPVLEMHNGKMIMNVASSPAAAGASAIEVLQQVPGVAVLNNRISLAGREGVVILLDGRTTHYTDVVSVLKDFPSSNIERIEVVTQPGAAYDAAGSAGIINIVLKKNADMGTNGSTTLTAGYGRFAKGGAAVDVNHRTRAANVFGSYGYNYRKTYEQLNTDRVVDENGQRVSYAQQSYQPRASHVNTARVGADFTLSPRQTLGVLLNGYTTRTDVNAENRIDVTQAGELARTTTRNNSRRRTDSYAGNLNYKLALDSLGRELVLDADYSRYSSGNDSRLTNALEASDGPALELLRFEQQTDIRLRSFKADYHHPLGAKTKLDAGAKISDVDIDSRLDFARLAQNAWLPVPGRSDHFRYEERISAAYVSLDKAVAGLQVQAGLRAEHTHSVARSLALDSTVRRSYLQLFPSLSVEKPLTQKLGVNLSYGRRIDRPSYQDLNPSVVYLDPYTQQYGNPFLRPQFTNAYKAAVTYQKQPVLQLAYNRTNNAISLVTAQRGDVLYSTTTNLGHLDNYSATLNFPLSLGKRVSGFGGTNVFYNQYRSQYLGGEYRRGKLSTMVYLQSKVRLPQGVLLELSGYYHSAGLNGLIAFRPFGSATVGLQKSFWKDQAQLRLSASDVLFTNKQRGTVRYQDMNIRFFTQSETQQVRASFSYKFGNQRLQAARKRATGLDEERGRVKSDKE